MLIRRFRSPRKEGTRMLSRFDCILAGATVVNQDGVALRDIGVTAGKVAEIGDLYAASAGERP